MIKLGLIVGFVYSIATLPSSWQLGNDAFARAGLYWSHILICIVVGGVIGAILKFLIPLLQMKLSDIEYRRRKASERCPSCGKTHPNGIISYEYMGNGAGTCKKCGHKKPRNHSNWEPPDWS